MEQAYLYCLALADRPDSPRDWSRAVKILDHVVRTAPIPAFAPLRHRLTSANRKSTCRIHRRRPSAGPAARPAGFLGLTNTCSASSPSATSIPTILTSAPRRTRTRRIGDRPQSGRAVLRTLENRTRACGRACAGTLQQVPGGHPDSFWGHYRAAAVSYGLGGGRISPARPVIWRGVSSDVPTTRCCTITSPPA